MENILMMRRIVMVAIKLMKKALGGLIVKMLKLVLKILNITRENGIQ